MSNTFPTLRRDGSEKPRILFAPAREHTEKVFAPEVMARLEAQFDVDRNDRDDDLTEAEVRERIAGCDGLVTGWGASDRRVLRPRGAMALTPAIMEAADRLRIIAHAAGSVRQMLGAVWQDYIAPRGICVFTATVEIGYNVRGNGGGNDDHERQAAHGVRAARARRRRLAQPRHPGG